VLKSFRLTLQEPYEVVPCFAQKNMFRRFMFFHKTACVMLL
jgi:hypothetical protein